MTTQSRFLRKTINVFAISALLVSGFFAAANRASALTPVTITATADSKTYNGSTGVTVHLTVIGVALGDSVTANFITASFNNRNVGTGKTVSITGITLAGADASLYSLADPTALATADITARPITVTAVTNTKAYDGTTSAAAIPTLTLGNLALGDVSTFTETYDTQNVGTGKILTPSGSVSDGNGGANYLVAFVNSTTGVITANALSNATAAVVTAESSHLQADVNAAQVLVTALPDGTAKTDLQTRINVVQAAIDAAALAAAKVTAHAALTTARALYLDADYTSANLVALNGFKTAGDLAIDAATDLAGVTSARDTALAGMDGVQTIAETDAAANTAAVASAKAAIIAATYTNLQVVDTANQSQKTAAVQAVVDGVKGTTVAVVTFGIGDNYHVAISKGAASDTTDVTATFSAAVTTHTITATAGPNGTISPPGAVIVNDGAPQAFSFTPATGYHVVGVMLDGVPISDPISNPLNLSNITADHTIHVTFASDITPPVTPGGVNLGTAGNFAIFANTAIANPTASSVITGDIGTGPGVTATAITGFALNLPAGAAFSTSAQVTGNVYAFDYAVPTPTTVNTASNDMLTAYNDAAGTRTPVTTELGAGNISGMTLAPGTYKWSTGVLINTDVTLSGSASDVWIFQIAGDLNIAPAGDLVSGIKVNLTGGAQAANVFWQVGGPVGATLGTYSTFNGTILSAKQIILQTGAVLTGRALAQTQVTLDANTVTATAVVLSNITQLTAAKATASGLITANAPESTTPGQHIVGSLATLIAANTAANATGASAQSVVDAQVAALNAAIAAYNGSIVPTPSGGGGGGGGGGGASGIFTPTPAPTPPTPPVPNLPNTGSTGSHASGTLIADGPTIYLVVNGTKRPFRDAAEFLSYGFHFSSVASANAADSALAQGSILKAMDGTLALDTSDNRTVYVIGNNGTKRGFVSAAVFKGLGYSFAQARKINLSDYSTSDPITSTIAAHPDGTLVISGQTIWWINQGQRHGFTSMDVFNSYGWTLPKVLKANAADMALPEGSVLQMQSDALLSGGWIV